MCSMQLLSRLLSVLPLATYMSQNVRFWVWWVHFDLLRWAKIVIFAYSGPGGKINGTIVGGNVAHYNFDLKIFSIWKKIIKIN